MKAKKSKKQPTLPPQLVRLLLLTVGIVVSYFVARYFLTPTSFREYGFYRGAALGELASRPVVFAGREACEECHFDEVDVLVAGKHKHLSCEGCHGPGQLHVDDPDIKLNKPRYALCVRCHEQNPSRPASHPQIDPTDHYTGDSCTECHLPHNPEEAPEEPDTATEETSQP